jgi:hypothetical protein
MVDFLLAASMLCGRPDFFHRIGFHAWTSVTICGPCLATAISSREIIAASLVLEQNCEVYNKREKQLTQ